MTRGRLARRPAKQWASAPASKPEMRAYYKSIRSKPKGKRPAHTPREFADA